MTTHADGVRSLPRAAPFAGFTLGLGVLREIGGLGEQEQQQRWDEEVDVLHFQDSQGGGFGLGEDGMMG